MILTSQIPQKYALVVHTTCMARVASFVWCLVQWPVKFEYFDIDDDDYDDIANSMLVWHRVEAYEPVTVVGQAAPLIDIATIRKTKGWQLLEDRDENYLAMTPDLMALFGRCGDSSEKPARVMMCESDQDPRAPGPLPPGCEVTPPGAGAHRDAVTAYWSTLKKALGDAAVAAEEPAKPPDSDVGTQWGDSFLCVSDRHATRAATTIMHKVDVSMWFRDDVEFRAACRVG